jgi:hypothetical protein
LRLEWLEYLLDELLAHSRTGVSEVDLPIFPDRLQ